MQKEIYDRLSQLDKIELIVAEQKYSLDYGGMFMIGLICLVGASICIQLNNVVTAKLLLIASIWICISYFFVTLASNVYWQNKLEKEFTKKALGGKQDGRRRNTYKQRRNKARA